MRGIPPPPGPTKRFFRSLWRRRHMLKDAANQQIQNHLLRKKHWKQTNKGQRWKNCCSPDKAVQWLPPKAQLWVFFALDLLWARHGNNPRSIIFTNIWVKDDRSDFYYQTSKSMLTYIILLPLRSLTRNSKYFHS